MPAPSLPRLSFCFFTLCASLFLLPAAQAVNCGRGLEHKIAVLEKRDQVAREAMWAPRHLSDARKRQLEAAMEKADHTSSQFVSAVLRDCGWPRRSQIGTEAALAFSLLTVHATAQPALQRYALHLMTPLVATGEASKQYFAILTDKIRVGAGEKQLYGTQLDGKLTPFAIDDEVDVDVRRAALGMETLKDYIEEARAVYQPQAKTK
jgi:hypothetical protein